MKKNNNKDAEKNAAYQAFMTVPIPACISRLKDGKFIAVNEAGAKLSGAKREDMIGRKSTELGYISQEQRKLMMDELKENQFVRNITMTFKIKNVKLQALMAVSKFKMGKEDFLFNFIFSISNQKDNPSFSEKDLFYKLTLLDLKYIKDRLKPYKLTPRQTEITVLSASGKSNQDIAKQLYISEHTVKDHLKEIFKAIGVNNRTALIPKLLNLS